MNLPNTLAAIGVVILAAGVILQSVVIKDALRQIKELRAAVNGLIAVSRAQSGVNSLITRRMDDIETAMGNLQ
jgi:hypothetical protein